MPAKIPSDTDSQGANVAYIEAEGDLLLARAVRMDVERQLAESKAEGRRDTVGRKASTRSSDLDRQWTAAVDAEEVARGRVLRRIEASGSDGPILGIEALCHKYKLSSFERTALVLAVLAALDAKYEAAMGTIGHGSFCSDPSPETLWRYLDMDLGARIASRVAFLPAAPLLKHDLVTMTWGQSAMPYDLRGAQIHARPLAFDVILGLPVDDAAAGILDLVRP